MEVHFTFGLIPSITVNSLSLLTGSSETNGWSLDFGAKTKRSSMSCDSIYCPRTFDMLGNPTSYEFGKPWVCLQSFCFVTVLVWKSLILLEKSV